MKREVLLCAHGILSGINDVDWARRYAALFDHPPERTGEPYVYEADVLGGMDDARNAKMADEIAELIDARNAAGEIIDLAAHSHACLLILLALLKDPTLHARKVTLIGAAADVDCDKNGLNHIAENRQVQRVQILYSRHDTVLAGPGLLPGYGQLGLWGVRNASAALGAIVEQYEFHGDHSSYFDPQNDARTFELVTNSALSGGPGLLPAGEGSPLPTQNTPEPRADGLGNLDGRGLGLQSDGGQG